MIIKHILAGALVAPFLIASVMAQDVPLVNKHIYQGGPGSNIPHATRQMTSWDQVYAMAPRAKAKSAHAYRGGPQTVVPHGY